MINRTALAATIFIVTAFSLNGCGTAAPDSSEIIKITSSQEKRIGIIQSLGGAYTSTGATHLLKMEDGRNVYLKSQNVALDSEKYRDKQLEVMGEITRTRDGNQVMEVMSVDILDQELVSLDETPLWTDYSSNGMGITFKYRDDYAVTEVGSKITVVKIESLADTMSEGAINGAETSKMYMELVSPLPDRLAELMGVESMTPADILAGGYTRSKVSQKAYDAYKISGGQDQIDYWLANQNGVYKFSYQLSPQEVEKTDFQNMFFDILASMELSGATTKINEDDALLSEESDDFEPDGTSDIDSMYLDLEEDDATVTTTFEEISGFTTFQSESAGFSIQYPKSYYFGQSEQKAADAIRSYQFGNAPLEEASGEIVFEIINSPVPQGQKITFNGMAMTKTLNDSDLSFYAEAGGKTYRISGPSSKENVIKQMLSTVN